MSLLEWAAKSRHESAKLPVMVAALLPPPGTASAGAAPPSQAGMASHAAARTVRFMPIATSSGNGCLHFLQRRRTAGPDTWPPLGAEPRTNVGFGPGVALDKA